MSDNQNELNELNTLDEEKVRKLAAIVQQQEEEKALKEGRASVKFLTTPYNKNDFTIAEKRYAWDEFLSNVEAQFSTLGTDRKLTDCSIEFDKGTGIQDRPKYLIDSSQDAVTKSINISYQADKDASEISHTEWVEFFGAFKESDATKTPSIISKLANCLGEFKIYAFDRDDALIFKKLNPTTNEFEELLPDQVSTVSRIVTEEMKRKMLEKDKKSAPGIYTHLAQDAPLLSETIKMVKAGITPLELPDDKAQSLIHKKQAPKITDFIKSAAEKVTPSTSTKRKVREVIYALTPNEEKQQMAKELYGKVISAIPSQAQALRALNKTARNVKQIPSKTAHLVSSLIKEKPVVSQYDLVRAKTPEQLYVEQSKKSAALKTQHQAEMDWHTELAQTLIANQTKDLAELENDQTTEQNTFHSNANESIKALELSLTAQHEQGMQELKRKHAKLEQDLFKEDPLQRDTLIGTQLDQMVNQHEEKERALNIAQAEYKQEAMKKLSSEFDESFKLLIHHQTAEKASLANEHNKQRNDLRLSRQTLHETQLAELATLQSSQNQQTENRIQFFSPIENLDLAQLEERQRFELHHLHQLERQKLDHERLKYDHELHNHNESIVLGQNLAEQPFEQQKSNLDTLYSQMESRHTQETKALNDFHTLLTGLHASQTKSLAELINENTKSFNTLKNKQKVELTDAQQIQKNSSQSLEINSSTADPLAVLHRAENYQLAGGQQLEMTTLSLEKDKIEMNLSHRRSVYDLKNQYAQSQTVEKNVLPTSKDELTKMKGELLENESKNAKPSIEETNDIEHLENVLNDINNKIEKLKAESLNIVRLIESSHQSEKEAFASRETALSALKKSYDSVVATRSTAHSYTISKCESEITVQDKFIKSLEAGTPKNTPKIHEAQLDMLVREKALEHAKLDQKRDALNVDADYYKKQLDIHDKFISIIKKTDFPVRQSYVQLLQNERNSISQLLDKASKELNTTNTNITNLDKLFEDKHAALAKQQNEETKQIETAIHFIVEFMKSFKSQSQTMLKGIDQQAKFLISANTDNEDQKDRIQHILCCASNATMMEKHFGKSFCLRYIATLVAIDPVFGGTPPPAPAQSSSDENVDINAQIAFELRQFKHNPDADDKKEIAQEINEILVKVHPTAQNNESLNAFFNLTLSVKSYVFGYKLRKDKFAHKNVADVFELIESNQRANHAKNTFLFNSPLSSSQKLFMIARGYQFVQFAADKDPNVSMRKAKTAYLIRHLEGKKTAETKTLQGIYVLLCNYMNAIPLDIQKSKPGEFNAIKAVIEAIELECVSPHATPSVATVTEKITEAAKNCICSIPMDDNQKVLLVQLLDDIKVEHDWVKDPRSIVRKITIEDVMNAFIEMKLAQNDIDIKNAKDKYNELFMSSGNLPTQVETIEYPPTVTAIDPSHADIDPDVVVEYGKNSGLLNITVDIFQATLEKVMNEPTNVNPPAQPIEMAWFQYPVEKLKELLRSDKNKADIDIDFRERHPFFKGKEDNKLTF